MNRMKVKQHTNARYMNTLVNSSRTPCLHSYACSAEEEAFHPMSISISQ